MAANASSKPVKNSDTFKLTLIGDNELEMTRVFDAPKALVFEAHSKPEHIKRWWGLREHEMIHCEMDFKPGGKWRFVQRAPNGEEYGFRGEYREIVKNERITWTFEYEGWPGKISVETTTLKEENGRTTVTARMVFAAKEDRDSMVEFGMEWGARQTWDRLEELMELLQPGQ
jgi:uncharacterized protein YndB with AHSA1/START domain